MKNDPTFKLVAAAILAGVIVAFVTPAHTVETHDTTTATHSAPATD